MKFHEYLKQWVYGNRSAWELARPACEWGGGVLLVGFMAAIPLERRRWQLLRKGRRERGPELVRGEQFNRQRTGDIGFVTKEKQSLRERLFMRYRHAPMVLIPKRDVSHHFLILGDTGTGKSSLFRQMLMQIEQDGETAIVYDPALEYTPQFYSPERGDMRCGTMPRR